jgi:DNA-binding LacI/PurR family transcriptional regulator
MVSRVLSNYGYFSENTRVKVKKAASKLDYRPHAIARSLRKGHTKAIGMLTSNIVSYHWTTFIRGVEEAAMRHGFHVILSNTNDDLALERAYLKTLFERHVDGIIISPSLGSQDDLQKLANSGFPMVLIDSGIASLEVPKINLDNLAGAYEATSYLISLGHTRIGLIAGSLAIASGLDRRQGYLNALKDGHISHHPELIACGDYQFEQAYQATQSLLSLAQPPTALLVCNEIMTGATLQCLKDNHVAIPEDISLVAFDDPAWASFFQPALTAVRTPRYAIGSLAFETLLAAIKHTESGTPAPQHMIKTRLMIRESCRPLHTMPLADPAVSAKK